MAEFAALFRPTSSQASTSFNFHYHFNCSPLRAGIARMRSRTNPGGMPFELGHDTAWFDRALP